MALCTENATLGLRLDYWWFESDNGSRLYCPDIDCNDKIKADPDVAGPGVLIANIVLASATVGITTIFVITSTDYARDFKAWLKGEKRCLTRRSKEYSRINGFCFEMLKPLIDLQLITGIAVMVAALKDIHRISLYHLTLLIAYWNLTFNSLWAMEVITVRRAKEYRAAETKSPESSWRMTIQRSLAGVSSILSIVAQVFSINRSCHNWNALDGRNCYRYLYLGQGKCEDSWFWVVGQCIFVAGLIARSVKPGRNLLVVTDITLANLERRQIVTIRILSTLMHSGFTSGRTNTKYNLPLLNFGPGGISGFLKACGAILVSSTALVLLWSLRQFNGIWAIGDGTPALQIWGYFVLFIINVIDPLSMKFILNKPLVEDSEMAFGVGQILPLVLLLSLFMNTFEALHTVNNAVNSQNEGTQLEVISHGNGSGNDLDTEDGDNDDSHENNDEDNDSDEEATELLQPFFKSLVKAQHRQSRV